MRRAVGLGLVLVATLTACSPEPQAAPAFTYPTHCGVGQAKLDGVMYYPTGVYDGGELITENDPSWYTSAGGPTPWITVNNHAVTPVEGSADMNSTFGRLVERSDGTAEFFVANTDYSIRLSDDKDDAAWIIEGCA